MISVDEKVPRPSPIIWVNIMRACHPACPAALAADAVARDRVLIFRVDRSKRHEGRVHQKRLLGRLVRSIVYMLAGCLVEARMPLESTLLAQTSCQDVKG